MENQEFDIKKVTAEEIIEKFYKRHDAKKAIKESDLKLLVSNQVVEKIIIFRNTFCSYEIFVYTSAGEEYILHTQRKEVRTFNLDQAASLMRKIGWKNEFTVKDSDELKKSIKESHERRGLTTQA